MESFNTEQVTAIIIAALNRYTTPVPATTTDVIDETVKALMAADKVLQGNP